ncbi:MAG: relaxase domain-containing protein [Acidimicrobiales bacterium]|jgi:hypothetical protein
MRMMGAESLAYHEHAVLGRAQGPVEGALGYYASRGETPMAWGGSGAARLGLSGEVDLDEWRAVFAVLSWALLPRGPAWKRPPST